MSDQEKEYTVKIVDIRQLTHDVRSFVVEKPADYKFVAGQATEIGLQLESLGGEREPFTFTSLASDENLEFIIKKYPEGKGFTEAMHRCRIGDKIIIGEPWGTIRYKGPGTFIAGGAGITPFIAILRQLAADGRETEASLMFSNKASGDIILEDELKESIFAGRPGDIFLTLTEEEVPGYLSRRIDKSFLKDNIKDFDQHFYVCGPSEFVEDILAALKDLGAEPGGLIFEE